MLKCVLQTYSKAFKKIRHFDCLEQEAAVVQSNNFIKISTLVSTGVSLI